MSTKLVLSMAVCATLIGCGSDDGPDPDGSSSSQNPPGPDCVADADCGGETPLCDVTAGTCQALPKGWEIGYRDGSPGSVIFTQVFFPDKARESTDLQFNPSKPTELWIVNRDDDSAFIVQNPGAPDSTFERRRDPAASHFMESPPALAFGVVTPQYGQAFAVCGDDDNSANGFDDFMGPALFSADLEIFAQQTSGGLGSHLDMLHSTSFCRGIAHLVDNLYIVFNSDLGSLDKYDFNVDHGPGNDDHSDGEILRYATGSVLGVEGIPSHLVLNPADGWVYIADTGHKRIAKLDPNSGTMGSGFGGDEPVEARNEIDGAVILDFVPPGTLEAPSGIEIKGDVTFVSDNATSRFYAFDAAGQLLRTLDTGWPPGALVGFTIGPADGKIYFVDLLTSAVFRIDPI